MDAQGAVDSLLGRLTSILVNEAQLLGGVRSDVEFIKEEMECMNSLLLHLTEAQQRNHQVRTWMKQVVGLTRDCGGNIELYLHYVDGAESGGKGILGFLLRIPRFLQTVSVRHRIATRIQELKVRARDVGDRRLRYGVTVPLAEPYKYQTFDDRPVPQPGSQEEEAELQRRELLDRSTEPGTVYLEESTNEVLEELSKKVEVRDDGKTEPRFILISRSGEAKKPPGIARRVYQHSTVLSSFQHRVFADLATMDYKEGTADDLLHNITRQLPEEHLEGKKIIIVLDNILQLDDSRHGTLVRGLLDFLGRNDCSHGNSLIVSTPEYYPGLPFLGMTEIYLRCTEIFFGRRAVSLAKCDVPCASGICVFLYEKDDTLAFQMFLRLIYVNPNWPRSEMDNLYNVLNDNGSNTGQTMLRFCYKDLPSNHKSCLLYLSIFPQDRKIRKTSLLRRWIAEGLVNQRSNLRLINGKGSQGISSLDDEAQTVFEALVTRGFLHPAVTSAAGKIRTFTVPTDVYKFIVRDLSYMDTCMPSDLAHRLSIHNGVQLQEAQSSDGPFGDVLTLLEQITDSVPWQLLKVLDLEGSRGLTKKHVKAICQILLLKYLSLRDTDVSELPTQIERLQCLETLDIRQTEVQTFSKKQIKLPMLRYFLAGHIKSPSNSFSKFKDTFTTVRLPRGIRRMKKLQVLSYVDISDNMDDLNDVGELLQLRKLGVILDCKKDSLSALFRQIEKLHGCLRSLSIRISKAPGNGPQATAMDTPSKRLRSLSFQINNRLGGKAGDTGPQATAMDKPPKHLQSLKISGITGGLPLWIAALDQLEEISLSETELGEDAMETLGKLRILRCLQLLQGSYTPSNLNFKTGQFQQLRSLVVEGVTNIKFEEGSTLKLRTIVWSFSTMEGALSGLDHLPKLNKLELDSKYNLDTVNAAIEAHPNNPVLEHNPRYQHKEDRHAPAAEASSS